MLVPNHVRELIIPEIYRRAIALDWESLSQERRVQAYDAWARDPEVQQALGGYLGGPEKIRSWIKDGPMKHFSNARRGAGRYVEYMADSAVVDVSTKILAIEFDSHWSIDDDSRGTKPLSFVAVAQDAESRVHIVHGPSRKFRDLAWGSIQANVDDVADDYRVIIVERPGVRTSPSDRERQRRVAALCGFTLDWVEIGGLT